MARGRPHAIAESARGRRLLREHGLERFLDRSRTAVRQAGDDGATRIGFRIRCQHHGCHGAAGRETSNEHPAAVDAEFCDRVLDHLLDRERLALVTCDVAGQEP